MRTELSDLTDDPSARPRITLDPRRVARNLMVAAHDEDPTRSPEACLARAFELDPDLAIAFGRGRLSLRDIPTHDLMRLEHPPVETPTREEPNIMTIPLPAKDEIDRLVHLGRQDAPALSEAAALERVLASHPQLYVRHQIEATAGRTKTVIQKITPTSSKEPDQPYGKGELERLASD